MWNPQWHDRRVRSNSFRRTVWTWYAAMIANGCVGLFGVSLAGSENLVPLLLPIIGLAVLAYTIHVTLRHRSYGGSSFRLRTLPGRIGGELAGDLVIPTTLSSTSIVNLTLRCTSIVRSPGADGEDITRKRFWSDSRAVPVPPPEFGSVETVLPVAFTIPADCPPTDETNPKDTIAWELTATAAAPWSKLKLTFPVPVFRPDVHPLHEPAFDFGAGASPPSES